MIADDSTPPMSDVPSSLPINVRAEEYGELQRVITALFQNAREIDQLDVVILVEAHDLCDDLKEVVRLLPPGRYTRAHLCNQINSIVTAHGWGATYGTVS